MGSPIVIIGIAIIVLQILTLWTIKAYRGLRERQSIKARIRYSQALDRDWKELNKTWTDVGNTSELLYVLSHNVGDLAAFLNKKDNQQIDMKLELESKIFMDIDNKSDIEKAELALIAGWLHLGNLSKDYYPLLDSQDPDMTHAICKSIALHRNGEAVFCLLDYMLQNDKDHRRITEWLGQGWALNALRQAAREEQYAPIRAWIYRALGEIKDPDSTSLLLRVIQSMHENEAREEQIQAIRSLGLIGEPSCAQELRVHLKHSDWVIRSHILYALAQIGFAEDILYLQEGLSDSSWWVRSRSAQGLRLYGQDGIDALNQLLESEDEFARDRALEALQTQELFDERVKV